jgi:hypothetical protein
MIGDIHLKKVSSSRLVSKTRKVSSDPSQTFELDAQKVSEDVTSSSIHSVTIQEFNQIFLLNAEAEKNKKGVQYGNSLIDSLEKLKNQILLGMLDEETLMNLKNLIDNRSQTDLDPNLESILQEIQIRVEVELAKFNLHK